MCTCTPPSCSPFLAHPPDAQDEVPAALWQFVWRGQLDVCVPLAAHRVLACVVQGQGLQAAGGGADIDKPVHESRMAKRERVAGEGNKVESFSSAPDADP